MKLGHKNLELIVTATMAVAVVTIFLLYPAPQLNLGATVITQALTNAFLLLIFGALLVGVILLLRIYGRLDQIERTLRESKKGVTPVLSIVLLLMMTVATFVLAYLWLINVQQQAGIPALK